MGVCVVFLGFGKDDSKNRDKLEIVRDMLLAVVGKVKKTRIMYQANLNYSQVEKYLSLLLRNDLIECDGDSCYSLTLRGKDFLKSYAAYVDKCGRVKKEVERTAKDRVQLESLFFNNECGSKQALAKKDAQK
ncbi:MAG: winged helix-turn-helix domain-containing protein [Candidatus Bathyarchaeota archaeon]|nr:winged helix-turn-helix domain-containing protein [Candidatus Bathyarchaeota archaeon]